MLTRSRFGKLSADWSRSLAGLGLALSCSACAGLPQSTPSLSQTPSPYVRPETGFQSAQQTGQPAGTVRIRQASPAMGAPGDEFSSAISLASYAQPAINCPPDAITSCPPEPRYPVPGQNPYGVGMAVCDDGCYPHPSHFPDEYLCDGGDREWPVHYGEDVRLGLDTEDTVAEFQTHHGRQGLTKSNKVCVYSPRFAAVRSVSLPHEEGTFREVAGLDQTGFGGEMRTRQTSTHKNLNLAAGGALVRSRASGLESEQIVTNVVQRLRPVAHDKVLNTFQDIGFFRSGTLEQGDLARLNLGIRAALVWSREQTPVIQGKIESATTGLSEVHASALTIVEHDDRPGTLRIVKAANKHEAEIGDVITFTIRYDNLGANPVSSVRIIDNLTPRLEYVDDSATCDVAGRLVVQDNGEGSLVLIWELDEPVPAKSGGVVTFQARVR